MRSADLKKFNLLLACALFASQACACRAPARVEGGATNAVASTIAASPAASANSGDEGAGRRELERLILRNERSVTKGRATVTTSAHQTTAWVNCGGRWSAVFKQETPLRSR